MANGREEATFAVNFEADSGPTEDAAASLEELRERIEAGQKAIKAMSSDYRRLKGSSDEVKKAKAELSAKIQAETQAITAAQLRITKAGTSLDALAAASKRAQTGGAGVGSAFSAAGGPLASLQNGVGGVLSKLGGIKSVAAAAALGIGLIVAAAGALVVGIGAAAVALGRFVVAAGNAARDANLLREAATGSAANAYALGTQVDALADKLPTAKNELNALAVSLAKAGIQGQTLVDTFNATAQASAALGDDVGSTIRELVERGRQVQRLQINPLELQGKGLGPQFFEEVAGELSKTMKVSVKEAQAALLEGRVKLGDGAAALRAAVEKKFGDINLRKALSIDGIAKQLREKLAALTSGVNLEPLLKAGRGLTKIFDETTVTGDALKRFVTFFGNTLVSLFEKAAPLAKKFVQGLIIGGLKSYVAWLQVKNAFAKFLPEGLFKDLDGLAIALKAGELAAKGIAIALATVGAVVAAEIWYLSKLAAGWNWLTTTYDEVKAKLSSLDWWKNLGTSIVDGITEGIKSRIQSLKATVGNLAKEARAAFADTLKIRSPSKVFAELGENTAAGYAQGVEAGTPGATKAVTALAEPPTPGPGGAKGAGGGGTANVTVNFNFAGGGGDAAKTLQEPSVLGPLVKILEDAVTSGMLAAARGG